MNDLPEDKLLDVLDELCQSPPEQRSERLDKLALSADERRQVERWLGYDGKEAAFLRDSPSAVRDAMHSLREKTGAGSSHGGFSGRPSGGERSEFIAQPPSIAGFEIQGLLGEGGMGTVWRARQLSTGRDVALKAMRPLAFASMRAKVRFDREVQLTARLEHPNVARVYDSGFSGGVYYYALELVDGLPLDDFVRARALECRQVLELMLPVCRAVAHAHQKGVIHRDLKPSNILVDHAGSPRVVDFGLAKAFDEAGAEPTETTEGQLAGTPAFMSPEHAGGRSDRLDTRTDVYALGATLYFLLTNQHPHDQSGPRYEVLPRIAREEIRPPRQLKPELDRELEALLLKALAQEPDRRYGSVGELARDIQRYLAGEPLEAAPPSATYVLRKFARKYRVPLTVAAGFVLVLVAATVVSSWQAVRATRARNAEALQRTLAQRAAASEAAQRRQAETVEGLLESVFAGLSPYSEKKGGPDLKTQLVTQLDETAAKLDKDYAGEPLVRARLRTVLGWTQLQLGEVTKAEALFKSALVEQQRYAAPDDAQTLTTLHHLAVAYLSAGRHGEAIKLLEQVRDRQVRKLGPDDPDTLRTQVTLASAYDVGAGRNVQAIALGEQLRDPLIRKLGPDHKYTLGALADLAGAYLSAGRIDEATKLFEQVRDQQIKKLGPEHPSTLITLHNLAMAYGSAGRTAEQIKLLERVRDQQIKQLGPEHPTTVLTLVHLASCYGQKGQYANAEPIWWRVYESSLAHPDALTDCQITAPELLGEIITFYSNLGQAEGGAKWESRLRALLEDSLAKQTAALAARPSDPALLADRARLYGRLGRFREAVADFDRAIALDPDQHLYWHDGAVPLRLARRDVEGYRRRRTEELHRLATTKQPEGPHRAVKDACMMPLEGEELQITLKLADRALAERGTGATSLAYAALTKGMAEYRAAHYTEAIDWLRKSADGEVPHRDLAQVTLLRRRKFFSGRVAAAGGSARRTSGLCGAKKSM